MNQGRTIQGMKMDAGVTMESSCWTVKLSLRKGLKLTSIAMTVAKSTDQPRAPAKASRGNAFELSGLPTTSLPVSRTSGMLNSHLRAAYLAQRTVSVFLERSEVASESRRIRMRAAG